MFPPPIDGSDPMHTLLELQKARKSPFNAMPAHVTAPEAPPAKADAKPPETIRGAQNPWKSADAGVHKTEAHFSISTRQILNLIQRYRLESLSFQDLSSLPMSQLTPEERGFVNYLRRNPDVFTQIAGLDQLSSKDTITPEDIKLAAQLSGDTLSLTDEDLRYLRQSPATPQALRAPQPVLPGLPPTAQQARLQTQDLIQALNRLIPPGEVSIPYEALVAMSAQRSGLRGRDLEALRFLQTATVSKVLERVAKPYNGMITPEVLRVLTSLLWNPSIYGAAPIVFFKAGPKHPDWDIEGIHEVDILEPVDDQKHDQIRNVRQKPSLRMEAHHLLNILHNINQRGEVTLEEIREYEPRNLEEKKALNLLRQANVFNAIAGLDEHPESLSEKDVLLALSEKVLVLSDPYMVLVILP